MTLLLENLAYQERDVQGEICLSERFVDRTGVLSSMPRVQEDLHTKFPTTTARCFMAWYKSMFGESESTSA